jgi:hypothetical protein
MNYFGEFGMHKETSHAAKMKMLAVTRLKSIPLTNVKKYPHTDP